MLSNTTLKKENVFNTKAYTSDKILSYISKLEPLTSRKVAEYAAIPSRDGPPMNEYECKVAQLFLDRGLVVYNAIPIGPGGVNADFYIYNPKSRKGKLVEITLMERENYQSASPKTVRRKKRQLTLLSTTEMPFVVLYRDNLESIKRFVDRELF